MPNATVAPVTNSALQGLSTGQLDGVRLTAALDEIALSSATYVDFVEKLSKVVPQLVGARKLGLMLAIEDRRVLQTLPGSHGLTEAKALSSRLGLDDPRSAAARVFATGETEIHNEVHGDASVMQDYSEAFRLHSVMIFCLRIGDRPVGILQIANKPDKFNDHDAARIEELLPRIAAATEHVRTGVRLRRKEALESVLSRMAVAVATGEPIDGVLQDACAELSRVTHARIMVLSIVGGTPFVHRNGEFDEDLAEAFMRESERDMDVIRSPITSPRAGDPGSAALHVPVLISGRRVASVSLARRRAEPFSKDEREALLRLAGLAALAWATDRRLQQHAEMARLRERQRIADELHHEVAQILFSGKITLESLLEFNDLPAERRLPIKRALSLLTRGETAIRDVIYALAPPEPQNLIERLQALLHGLDEQFAIGVDLTVDRDRFRDIDIPRSTAHVAVKVAREAIVNAAKHAGPCRISVTLHLRTSNRLVLIVRDDGIGMLRNGRRGHGLMSLRREVRELDGCLRVSQGRCGGTRVTVGLPLPGG